VLGTVSLTIIGKRNIQRRAKHVQSPKRWKAGNVAIATWSSFPGRPAAPIKVRG